MSQFWWPDLHHDVSLAKEVVSARPRKGADWEKIAVTLSALFSTGEKPVELKGRGCGGGWIDCWRSSKLKIPSH